MNEKIVWPKAKNAASPEKNAPSFGYGDYLRFSKLLLDRAGLHFAESRRPELEISVRQAFAASTCASLDEYFDLISDQQSESMEMDRLVNAVTVSETHFFRDQAQFDALWNIIMPRLLDRKRSSRTLRIWSAGCASGEEPYSIAMMLRELLPDIDQWAITILGTDINSASLERARIGHYGNWAFREERAKALRPQYFHPVGNRYELIPEVRQMVIFNKLNLVEPCYPSYETNTMLMDMIICRNVTIYFSEAITRWVVDRYYDGLAEGGWLVVGHAEPSVDIYRRFRVRNYTNTVMYQKSPPTRTLHLPASRPTAPQPIPIPPPPVVAPTTFPPQIRPFYPPPATSQIIPPVTEAKGQDPLELARELIEFGRSEDACKILANLVTEHPANATSYALLGKANANLGNWQEAETWCRQAIAKDKLNLEAYYTLALVLQHESQFPQALDMMRKVIYLDRNYILGHYGLANLFFENSQFPQAHKSLDNALRLLQGKPNDQMVPGSADITIGRLREAITRQQQAWSGV